jgi:hypothetical protein
VLDNKQMSRREIVIDFDRLLHCIAHTDASSVGKDGIGGVRGDAALVAGVARHGDKTIHAPTIAPRIFDHVPGNM